MYNISKIIVLVISLLIVGCGGGGSSSSNSPQVLSYNVKRLDIDNKEKFLITKENSQDIVALTKGFFSIAGGISEYSIKNAITENLNATKSCQQGGSITQTVIASNNQLSLNYKQCNFGSSFIVNGQVTYVLSKTTNGYTANYTMANNFKVTIGNESTTFNYTIKSYHDSYGANRWDYYINSYNSRSHERWEAELHIIKSWEEAYLSGIFLLNEKEYFNLGLVSHSDPYFYIFGPSEDKSYASYIDDAHDKLILQGEESQLTYSRYNREYIFIYNSHSMEYYAKDEEVLNWLDSPYTLFPSHSTPSLTITLNDTIFQYGKDIISLHTPTATLTSNFTDRDYFGRYELNVKLIAKPDMSTIDLDTDQVTYFDNHDLNTTLSFDVDGTYHFEVTLTDDSDIVKKDFYIKYYHTSLSENQFLIEGNTTDILVLRDRNHIAYISNNSIIISDLNMHRISSLSLLETPARITLSEDGKYIAVSAREKVYLIDIQDLENISISKTWDLPGSLGEIKLYKNHIYVLQNERNSTNSYLEDLYDINISDSSYDIHQHALKYGDDDARIHISTVQNALYLTNFFGDVFKFKITEDAISWDSNHSFRDTPIHCCDDSFWFISKDKVLTAYGNILSTSSTQANDLLFIESLESENLIQGNNNSYKTILAASDTNQSFNSLIISTTERTRFTSHDTTEIYSNILETYTLNSLQPKMVYPLQTYWKQNNTLYRLFVSSLKILSDDKVLITYKASKVSFLSLSDEYFLYSTKKVVYEIKTLEGGL